MYFKGKRITLKAGWTLVLNKNNNISVYDKNNKLLFWPIDGKERYFSNMQDEPQLISIVQGIADLNNWGFKKNTKFSEPAFTFTENK